MDPGRFSSTGRTNAGRSWRERSLPPAVVLLLVLLSACQSGESSGTSPVGDPPPPAVNPSPRKGVGTWSFAGGASAMADVAVSWYYTWRVDRQWEPAPTRVQFVPMIWDETHVTPDELTRAVDTGAGVLLGYNEPDHADQANMTVAEALDLWPLLEGTALRLGSPATAGNPARAGSWLERFMDGAARRGSRIDFVCVHWYGQGTDATTEARELEGFLRAVHDKYQKPIWLTEFALVEWTTPPAFPTYAEQAAFVRQALPMLESLPFVERYAWFALPPWAAGGVSATTNLYEVSGAPTAVGTAYESLGLLLGRAGAGR